MEELVQTTVEHVDETTVKLTVTVEAERVREAIERAAKELAGTVKVPGFRPGRVPRRVLESRLGKDALAEEAARDSLPSFYAEAVQAEGLPVVGRPSFAVATFEDGKDAEFTATVEVQPEVELPDYTTVQVAHPEWEVADEQVDHELGALRERFAELETVRRPADSGDFVVITITGKRGGQVVEEASGEDLLYQIGPGDDDTAIDKALLGTEAGAIVKFHDTLGPDYPEDLRGQECSFVAIVKEVKRKKLPDLDDDFAVTASEFDTIDELREDLRTQLEAHKRQHAAVELRSKVVQAVTDLVEVPLPESMVDDQLRIALAGVQRQAEGYGLTVEELAERTGTTMPELVERVTAEVRATVKAQLVVDAVGHEAGVEVTEQDLGAEVAVQAARLGQPPEKLAEFMLHPDRIGVVYADVFRRKAIDHLAGSVQVLSGPPPDEPAEPAEPDEAGDA
ncbi:MAG: trigger factor [Egibacteraceae bacterium]